MKRSNFETGYMFITDPVCVDIFSWESEDFPEKQAKKDAQRLAAAINDQGVYYATKKGLQTIEVFVGREDYHKILAAVGKISAQNRRALQGA